MRHCRPFLLLLAAALSSAALAQQQITTTTDTGAAQELKAIRERLDRLDAKLAPPAQTTTTATPVREEVRAALREEYKDAKLVELETSQAIAARVSNWAKLFGFFVGIPLGLIGLVLGFLGYKSVSDLKKLTARLAETDAQLTDLQTQIAERQKQLAELDQMQAKIERLDEKVQRLEEVSFAGFALPDDVKSRLNELLAKYRTYLQGIGWKAGAEAAPPTLEVIDRRKHAIAYYDGSKKTLFVQADYIAKTDVVLREYTHHVLMDTNNANIGSGESRAHLQSAYAYYFPCSFNDSPLFAKGMLNLSEGRSFAQAAFNSIVNHQLAAQTWGALFWDIREVLGVKTADPLLFEAWSTFKPPQKNFAPGTFASHIENLAGEHATELRKLFKQHGVTL